MLAHAAYATHCVVASLFCCHDAVRHGAKERKIQRHDATTWLSVTASSWRCCELIWNTAYSSWLGRVVFTKRTASSHSSASHRSYQSTLYVHTAQGKPSRRVRRCNPIVCRDVALGELTRHFRRNARLGPARLAHDRIERKMLIRFGRTARVGRRPQRAMHFVLLRFTFSYLLLLA